MKIVPFKVHCLAELGPEDSHLQVQGRFIHSPHYEHIPCQL